ncbi:CLIP domain-containing serine protease B9-like [Chrysoperla carnea]|uniref:CLIP domain-containing serine protease B9-like n=1 Tax=Chrysoperla carnea TaxID=189513 RepID=UPI001D097592|nr:CLIP domain-containing serine protease B9-like [Chrysoperla carnea]
MDLIVVILCILSAIKNIQSQNFYNNNAQGLCPPSSTCLRLSQCGLLNDLIHRSCVAADRFRQLTCGYSGVEPMLCCPTVGRSSIVPQNNNNNNIWRGYQNTGNDNNKPCGVTRLRGITGYNGLGAQPWVARIGFANGKTKEIKYPCGGSILSNRVILTAAHCALAKSENYKLYSVLVGEYATNTNIDCDEEFCSLPPQQIQISHVVVHPGYQQDDSYRDDVALIVLRDSINYTVAAQPICVFEGRERFVGERATLIGWGKLAGQQAQPSNQQSLTVPIVPMEKCRKVYGETVPLASDEEQICAGGSEGQDACAGFGGSPLVSKHLTGGVYYQIGLLSFGADKCGTDGVPSVYVNIQNYARWIRENTPLLY